MPFGIPAAPELFQRQMTKLLERLNGVACVMDDILVYGKNQYEHDKRVEVVMKRLGGWNDVEQEQVCFL